ncbi:MAG: TRAP transporter small permease [Deltaproteobacteria bacterium]|nr:TRAP transporter small permease [Deltaproteobacteria bacterium]
MLRLGRLKRFNQNFSAVVEWVGMVAFIFMMLLTTIDVIGAKVFQKPVPGSLDVMMLAQLVSMSFALGASLIANRHVAVEFFVPLMPESFQKISNFFVCCLMFFLFIIMGWQLFMYASELRVSGEVSPTIRIQLYPFVYGASFAFIPACLIALADFVESLKEVF